MYYRLSWEFSSVKIFKMRINTIFASNKLKKVEE